MEHRSERSKIEQLRDAIKQGDLAQTATLLCDGVNPNIVLDLNNTTMLMLAAQLGHSRIVDELVNNKAKVNARDSFGQTALMFGACMGEYDIVKSLLEKRAVANHVTTDGQTALMRAAVTRHTHTLPIIRSLIEHKTTIDLQRNDGRTALMLAVERGSLDIVELLFQQRANVELKSKDGHTAAMIAARTGSFLMLRNLVRLGATVDLAQLRSVPFDASTLQQMKIDAIVKELNEAVSLGLKDRESPTTVVQPTKAAVADDTNPKQQRRPSSKSPVGGATSKEEQVIWRNRTEAQDPVAYENDDETAEVKLRQSKTEMQSRTDTKHASKSELAVKSTTATG